MPLQATSGAATYDAFGGGVAAVPNYIEDVFSTYLYTGTDTTNTINNGIDLSGKGGLTWIKSRSAATRHCLFDTARGAYQLLSSDQTFGSVNTSPYDLSAFNDNGFTLQQSGYGTNASGATYASWTFRKQPKFFDVVTYTGNGTSQTINHNLGSVPGCIIVKNLTNAVSWIVYHRSVTDSLNKYLILNDSASAQTASGVFATPTSTTFGFTTSYGGTNTNGDQYVAYLFAHDAGGFGLSGTDNVISCGSYTGTGSTSGPTVTLGYEPQWVLIKNITTAGNEWVLLDNMRGMAVTGNSRYLLPNSSGAEGGFENFLAPTATGFQLNSNDNWVNGSSQTYIYIAIRRGPMKTPTTGTSVFAPVYVSATAGTAQTTNFPVDAQILRYPQSGYSNFFVDRLRGVSTTPANQTSPYILTDNTQAETTGPNLTYGWNNTGFAISSSFNNLQTIFYNFRRAPGFFDEVCYAGTGSATTVTHNLGVVPELMIVKTRNAITNWAVYSAAVGPTKHLRLNATNIPSTDSTFWNNTAPTASVFSVGGATETSGAFNYVAYLFASCPGVSKVGSYTGSGTTKQIDCGFTGGARFVLIKRTDSTGDWYVWDTARGIVSGNDPYLLLNSTAAEVTSTDYIDTYSAGFEISSTAPAAINANGGTFVFLAIA